MSQTPKDQKKVKTAIRCDCCGRRLRRIDEACPNCNRADFIAQYTSTARGGVRKVGAIEHFACSLMYFAIAVFTAAATTVLVAGATAGVIVAEALLFLTIPAGLLLGLIWSEIEYSNDKQSASFSSTAASLIAVTAVVSAVIVLTAISAFR